jgi:hypothetical protein
MKLRSIIIKGFLLRVDGKSKAAEEVFAVRHFINGFCFNEYL